MKGCPIVDIKSHENAPARILVVDDSLLMRMMVEELLVEAGFEVITAVDGMDAWEKLQEETIHAIVADLNMPRVDGLSLTKMVRSHKQLKELPIILISATNTNQDKQRGFQLGANAFIMKDRRQLELLPTEISNLLSDCS